MPSAQNKTVRLYGPWKGQDDSGTRTSSVEFERCFNMEFVGEEAVTRNGRVPFLTGGPAKSTAIGEIAGQTVVATYGTSPKFHIVTGVATWTEVTQPTGVVASDRWDSLVDWSGNLVLLGGYGANLVYDGATLQAIAAALGQDSTTVGYLTSLPAAKYGAKYHGRMYFVTLGGLVFFSEVEGAINIIPVDGTAPFGALNVWPAVNNFDARCSATDEARGCIVFGDQLVLPTKEGLFIYDDYELRRIPGAPGCAAPGSVKVTPKGLVYLASDGLHLFDGSRTQRISERMSETLQGVVRFGFYHSLGIHYPRRNQYRLYVPAQGDTRTSLCLVWLYDENRWMVHGGTPYWMAPSASLQPMEVSAAYVRAPGTEDEEFVTGDYDGSLWVEDIGLTDNGKQIVSYIVFSRVGSGEDAGVRVYRDLTIEARATGAPLKYALLADGEEFIGGAGADTGLFEAAPAVRTLISSQTTWGSNTLPASHIAGGSTGPVSTWRTWRAPAAKVSRSVQPAVWCDGADAAGTRYGGRMAIRGIELQFRNRRSHRGAA
jgi:hypothetical protein